MKESFAFEVRVVQHRNSSEDLIQGFRFVRKRAVDNFFCRLTFVCFLLLLPFFLLPILLFLSFIVKLLPPLRKLRKQTEQEILLI